MQPWMSCLLSVPFVEVINGAQFIANPHSVFCFVYLMPLANIQVGEVAAWHVALSAPQQRFC
jgi:hypothetical protein